VTIESKVESESISRSPKYNKRLNCSAEDLPAGMPTPDSPLKLEQLKYFCSTSGVPCLTTAESKSEKMAIMDPVRLDRIRTALEKLNPVGGTVILSMLNYGYAFLFTNFVCGCELRGITIRDSMIVVTTGTKAFELATKMGFAVVSTD